MHEKASTIRVMAPPIKWKTAGIALGAVAVLALGGGWVANASGVFDRPAPEPTSIVQDEPTTTPTITPTPTPTVEPVVEAPPAPPVEEAPVEEPVESGPDLCPPGTQANGSDGYNDTSCFPDSCYVGPVSNETHPECITAMPPDYYR
jgi:hypothetical protein